MTSAASQSTVETAVPSTTNTAPASASASWERRRSAIGPENDASPRLAKAPNAANAATWGLPITFTLSANSAGITIAVRPARRSASRPPSRDSTRVRTLANLATTFGRGSAALVTPRMMTARVRRAQGSQPRVARRSDS